MPDMSNYSILAGFWQYGVRTAHTQESTLMSKIIDPYSPISVRINLLCNDNYISSATGFFFEYGNNLFVVSNWHVFSGRNPNTGQSMNNSGAVPDTMEIALWLKRKIGDWQLVRMPMNDTNGEAVWLQHPNGQDIDVAVCRINEIPDEIAIYSLPRPDETLDMAFEIAMDVFIVGFPLGLSHQDVFPVWKRGSVATEPQLKVYDLPVFLVDSATREGMSGSPVYLRRFGHCIHSNGNISWTNGPVSRFVGIYSGRYGADDESAAQLGRVWRRDVIIEIIDAGIRGSYEIK